jgi:MFS family permease
MTATNGRRPISRRTEWLTCFSGMLTDGQSELLAIIIPFWALSLGYGPIELGLLISARAILPSILAIHGGVLMDRFGTRTVVLAVAAGGTVIPPLFNISAWFPILFVLQMFAGMFMSIGWMGAQALVVPVGKEKPAIVGRFAFLARVGVMASPLAVGAMWDFVPHWIAFAVIGLVGAMFWSVVAAIPPAELVADPVPGERAQRPPFRLTDIMPRLSDYIGAIGLMLIPAVAFVIIVSSVRIGSALMLQSFYIMHLKEMGLLATAIGGFITLSQMGAATGTLMAARVTPYISPNIVFLGAVMVSIFCVYSTPLWGTSLVVLAAFIIVRGMAQGISQPVMYTILSRAVGPGAQGTAIGLRSTGNRMAGLTLPPIMGVIAEFWGLTATFYITGALLLTLLALTGLWFLRKAPSGEPPE